MILLLGLAVLLAPQDPARLRVSEPRPAVVRLGEGSMIELSAPSATAEIDPRPPSVDGLQFQIRAPSRQSFQSIVNGRIERHDSTLLHLIVTPLRAGRFEIPPFVVRVDGRDERTRPLVLEAVEDLRGSRHAYLRIVPSATRVYVHEPLRLRIELGIDESIGVVQGYTEDRRAGFDARVQAGWLDELPGAVAIQAESLGSERVLIVNDGYQAADYAGGHERDGRRFHRLQFERAYLPTRSGRIELSRPTLRYAVLRGPARTGLFGEPIDAEREYLYAYGDELAIDVLPIPEAGRPPDYSGAVGRFTLQAEVDRRDVRVGNSVKLRLVIQGIGNHEFLRVPELDRLPGFHLRGKTEERGRHEVRAVYDLTPIDASVNGIPAIAWTCFDTRPGVETYVTLHTEPIPLRVEPLAEHESLAPLPGEEPAPIRPGVDDIHDIQPLDDAARWHRAAEPPAWLAGLLLLAPWLLTGLLAWTLPRALARRADVAGRRARQAARSFARALARGAEPDAALVDYLAARLGVPAAAVIEPELAARLTAAGLEPELAAELQRAVEQGSARRYGGGGGLAADAARALVARAEQRRARFPAPALLLLLALPQDPGVAAYRRGDYDAAAAEFAAARAATADRRLDYNLGNSRFRQGRYAEALLHYERARLGAPRDEELLANLALTRQRLGLPPAEQDSFAAAVAALRDRCTGRELLLLAVVAHALVAALVWAGRRRPLLRALALLAAVPAALLALELSWWRPARPPRGVLLREAAVRAEPREDLPAVLELRAGVTVDLLASGGGYAKVRAGGRSGWLRADAVGVVE